MEEIALQLRFRRAESRHGRADQQAGECQPQWVEESGWQMVSPALPESGLKMRGHAEIIPIGFRHRKTEGFENSSR
jgi:hypothetical protein